MTLTEHIQASETRVFKTVFPNTANHYDKLFGGTAMAFMATTFFSRQVIVTLSLLIPIVPIK